MMTAELRRTAPRHQVLAIVASQLVGRALRRALAERYDVIVAASPADALVRIARGQPFDLVLCDLPLRSALELHAAIARREPAVAGRMVVFRMEDLRRVIATVLALPAELGA